MLTHSASATAALLAGLALLLVCPACNCSEEEAPQCPAYFKVGDPCSHVGLECLPPSSTCGAYCACDSSEVWQCPADQWCLCTCFCGRMLWASCGLLGCPTADAHMPCPSQLDLNCADACIDSGPPDGRVVDGGAPDGPAVDSARDARPDAPDSARDLPWSDLCPDTLVAPADLDPEHDAATQCHDGLSLH